MSSDKNDPRDASLETEFTTPKTWFRDTSGASYHNTVPSLQFRTDLVCVEFLDGLGSSGMFLSGLIMVTKNRYVAVGFYINIDIWKEEGADVRTSYA